MAKQGGDAEDSGEVDQPALPDLPRRVLDQLLEGCQVISRQYRYLYANDAAVRHGRTSKEALFGRKMTECYPGIEDTEMFSILQRCMRDRAPAQVEHELMFPDGTPGWFELRLEPIPEGVVILSVDVTERKRAEAALRRAMRAQMTLSQCNQTLVRADDERRFVQEVCRLMVESAGYRTASIQLRDGPAGAKLTTVATAPAEERVVAAGDISRPSSPAWADALVTRVLGSGAPLVASAYLGGQEESGYGDDRAAICISLPIRERGECIGAMTICAGEQESFDDAERSLLDEVSLDLGYGIESLRARRERVRASEERADAQARTRAIYDHLPHATFVWRQHGASFELVDFNLAAKSATQGGVTSLLGCRAADIGAGVPHLEEDLSNCKAAQGGVQREVDCVLPGASQTRRMALSYGFIPPDMALLHAQDVTELRRTEEKLVATQRLEAVGRLAGGIAHDFNNMLSVILSYAELVLGQLREPDPIKRDLTQLREAALKAAELTRRLLAFSKKQIMEPKVTDLNSVIRGIELMLRRVVGEDVRFEAHLASDLGSVIVDKAQMEQVIINLAVNAKDAMPKGGRLTLETANAELDEQHGGRGISVRPGRYVQLSATDTGVGMDVETQSRVFEPFFTTKGPGKGTGLGLSMVYGIVRQSGGNIWVYSEPGKGTTFKIYLPRVDAKARQLPAAPRRETATGRETILLVEDEAAVRGAMERVLAAAGYRVLIAADGEQALRLSEERAGEIHLLLTDVVMPVMSGREVADRLKQQRPNLKVLFTSGYTDNAIVHHGMLDPGIRFIAKPFSVADLTKRVREALDEDT